MVKVFFDYFQNVPYRHITNEYKAQLLLLLDEKIVTNRTRIHQKLQEFISEFENFSFVNHQKQSDFELIKKMLQTLEKVHNGEMSWQAFCTIYKDQLN